MIDEKEDRYLVAYKNRLIDGGWKDTFKEFCDFHLDEHVDDIRSSEICVARKKEILNLVDTILHKTDISLFSDIKQVLLKLKKYFSLKELDIKSNPFDFAGQLCDLLYNGLYAHFNAQGRRYGYANFKKTSTGALTYDLLGEDKLDVAHFHELMDECNFGCDFNAEKKYIGMKGVLRKLGLAAKFTLLDIKY